MKVPAELENCTASPSVWMYIEKLEKEKAALLEHLRSAAEHGGVCIGCKHALEGPEVMQYCENIDFDCENCENKCPCHDCEKACNYEWVGVSG